MRLELDDRRRRVLAAIVRDYVSTAEPVGSKRLVERHLFRVSSATIRNDMSALEAVGLLAQPHTSAGRVPSDRGYRFFVDELMEIPVLSPAAERILRSAREHTADIDDMLREICTILSKVTQHTAVALVPGLEKSELRHFQISKVDGARCLIILVTDAGHVVHEFIDAGESYSAREVEVMSEILRRRLVGMKIDDIEALDTRHLRAEPQLRGLLLEESLRVVRDNLERGSYWVFIDGAMHIVTQPEFNDVERLQRVLHALEQEQLLAQLLSECLRTQGVRSRIGSEHEVEGVSDLSLVAVGYGHGGARGAVGVLGPTRMDYETVYAAVAKAADVIERVLPS